MVLRTVRASRTSPPLVALVAVACAVVAGTACRRGPSDQAGHAIATTTVPIARDSVVTLTGRVTRSYGPHVVQLGSSPTEPVLVVFRTPTTFPNGTRLEVSGTITTFSRSDLEALLRVDLGPQVEELVGSRCVIAHHGPTARGSGCRWEVSAP